MFNGRELISKGGTIVEGTAGNTGIGLAVVCKEFGLNLKIVIPNTQSIEKKSNLPNILGEYDKDSFFNLLKSIKNSNFRISNIKNLYFFKSGRWDIETKFDVIIKLPKDNLKDSLN